VILFAFDADEDRDVERRRGTAYVTRKQVLRWVAMIAVALAIGYFTLYRTLKENRDFVVSKNHLQALYRSLFLYANDNSEGLPAAYLPGVTDADGNPVTWANQLFQYTKEFDVFTNPSSASQGNTRLSRVDADGKRWAVELSYGLLSSTSAIRKYEVKDDTRILGETIGVGAFGSFNPSPLGIADGFMIGYDDSNSEPTADTKRVTRLAFLNDEQPIHRGHGVACLRANGGIEVLTAVEATRVDKRGKVPFGPWVP
jgi:hypothetical protein